MIKGMNDKLGSEGHSVSVPNHNELLGTVYKLTNNSKRLSAFK